MLSNAASSIKFSFELPQFDFTRLRAAWRTWRINRHNLSTVSARDLRDAGINPTQFEFDLAHPSKESRS